MTIVPVPSKPAPARRARSINALMARLTEGEGVSRWFLVGPDRVRGFAEAVGGDAPVGAGPGLAPSFLILSLLGAMARDALPVIPGARMGVNYGFDQVRMGPPVAVGAQIRGRFVLEAVTPHGDEAWRLVHAVQVEVMGRIEPALTATWVSLRIVGTVSGADASGNALVREAGA